MPIRKTWLSLMLGLCLLCAPKGAHAWLSIVVKADNVELDIASDGSATISHELLIRVRGGPLKRVTINGVDPDAEAVGEATLTKARSGKAAGVPILLLPQYDENLAHFQLTYDKGVGSGSYLMRFAYRTQLQQRGLVASEGGMARIDWVGPMFDDGIDSLQTTFVLPTAAQSPRLPGAVEGELATMVPTERGVFLAELSRDTSVDRLQVSRPHAAKHERVQWRVLVDKRLFEDLPESAAPPDTDTPLPVARIERAQARGPTWPHWSIAAAFATLFALLLVLKHALARTTFVVPMPLWLRVVALFGSAGGSVLLGLLHNSATLAGVALLLAMLLAVQRPPRAVVAPRGPGKWREIELATLTGDGVQGRRRGAWLDASSLVGLLCFGAGLAGFAVVGLRMLGQSPYYSAMTLVYSTSLVPLFFTLGAFNDKSLLVEQRDFLRRLSKRMAKLCPGVQLVVQGRFSADAARPDELRLRLVLPDAMAGLTAFEIGLGFVETGLTRLLVPVAIIRVREGSPAHKALPSDAQWSRGRDVDERVAVVRAPLPLLSSCTESVVELVGSLRQPKENKATKRRAVRAQRSQTRQPRAGSSAAGKGSAQRSVKARRSSGRGASASKDAKSALPSQVMR